MKKPNVIIDDQVYADGSKTPDLYNAGITLEITSSSAGIPARYGVLLTFKGSAARITQLATGIDASNNPVAAVRSAASQTTWYSWTQL